MAERARRRRGDLAKRDGGRLTDSQIDWVVDAYTRGEVADEQMSALAMAILLNGMDRREIARWTAAMIASGERMDFSGLSRPTADKHSTGGVGDKITLPLAPLVAACGVAVPQLSGRGLGHTGGTLDKLESIPGWRAALSNEEMLAQLESVGAVICAAGDGLAPGRQEALRAARRHRHRRGDPADRLLDHEQEDRRGHRRAGARREGRHRRVHEDVERARELAETMVALGTDAGVHTVALLTDMSTPLGLTAGNAIEVEESVEVLAGGGPADVVELTLALAREMLAGAGRRRRRPGRQAGRRLGDGRLEGDDPRPGRRPGRRPARRPGSRTTWWRPSSGVLTRLDAMAVGIAAWRLGAGRARKEDPVQAGAGVVLARPTGRPGHRGPAADDPPHRRAGPLRAGAGGRSTAATTSRRTRRYDAGPLVIDRVGRMTQLLGGGVLRGRRPPGSGWGSAGTRTPAPASPAPAGPRWTSTRPRCSSPAPSCSTWRSTTT